MPEPIGSVIDSRAWCCVLTLHTAGAKSNCTPQDVAAHDALQAGERFTATQCSASGVPADRRGQCPPMLPTRRCDSDAPAAGRAPPAPKPVFEWRASQDWSLPLRCTAGIRLEGPATVTAELDVSSPNSLAAVTLDGGRLPLENGTRLRPASASHLRSSGNAQYVFPGMIVDIGQQCALLAFEASRTRRGKASVGNGFCISTRSVTESARTTTASTWVPHAALRKVRPRSWQTPVGDPCWRCCTAGDVALPVIF